MKGKNMAEPSLRRGEEEDRSPYERLRDEFKAAKAAGANMRQSERLDVGTDDIGGCPTCHHPMLLRHSYIEPDHYKFEGICTSGNDEHHILRYGTFATDPDAITMMELDE